MGSKGIWAELESARTNVVSFVIQLRHVEKMCWICIILYSRHPSRRFPSFAFERLFRCLYVAPFHLKSSSPWMWSSLGLLWNSSHCDRLDLAAKRAKWYAASVNRLALWEASFLGCVVARSRRRHGIWKRSMNPGKKKYETRKTKHGIWNWSILKHRTPKRDVKVAHSVNRTRTYCLEGNNPNHLNLMLVSCPKISRKFNLLDQVR